MQQEQKPAWREYLKTAIVAVLVACALRMLVVSAYRVQSGSMEGSLLTGDFIFCNKLAYLGHEPQRDDIIVFKYPNNPAYDFMKRIIGLPGDTVTVINKQVWVNGRLMADPPHVQHVDTTVLAASASFRDNFGPFVVPNNEYFVLGDNRDDSRDSRFWGTVSRKNIKSKALFVYFSKDPKAQWFDITSIRLNRIGNAR
jgi:signal peptidase I